MSGHQLRDGRWVVSRRDPDNPGKYKRDYFGRGVEAEKKARAFNESLALGSYARREVPAHFSPIGLRIM